MRALEDALSSHKHRWPKEWDDKSPLSGGISFNDMGNTQRVRRIRGQRCPSVRHLEPDS
jgi:hypothetical protein